MLTAILLAIVAVLALWDGVAELRRRGRRDPAAILRLVAMVRWLADCIPDELRPCAGFSRKCSRGDITKCDGAADAECWITAAHAATEDRHD